jgi:hypothetical protein
VFVDVISASAVLYLINFANCYQHCPKKLEKKLMKEHKIKIAITIEKKMEILQKYECGIRVTDLANMYSFGCSERIMGISIISYGKNSLDLRPP